MNLRFFSVFSGNHNHQKTRAAKYGCGFVRVKGKAIKVRERVHSNLDD